MRHGRAGVLNKDWYNATHSDFSEAISSYSPQPAAVFRDGSNCGFATQPNSFVDFRASRNGDKRNK